MANNPVLQHFEKFLGAGIISSTAKDAISGEGLDINICLFKNKPVTNAFTLATIGLSNKVLHQPDKTPVKHEIVFCAHRPFLSDELYARLFDVADEILSQEDSITIGQLFDFEEPLSGKTKMEAFVFYEPGYFDDGLFVYEDVDPAVIVAWAIPIHRKEMEFIEKNGPEAFDELLAEHDPDLMDLSRASIV